MEDVVDWLNDNSGAVQAIATVILVLVTAFYVIHTRSMSKSAAKQAEASMKMAAATREQAEASMKMAALAEASRLGAFQPLLTLKIRGRGQSEIKVGGTNYGNGPALDLGVTYREQQCVYTGVRKPEIGPGEEWDRVLGRGPAQGEDASLPSGPGVLLAEYQDIEGNWYRTTLEFDRPEAAEEEDRKMSFYGPSRDPFRKELANDS